MSDNDLKFMRMAIDQARQCVSEGGHARPKVGAVIVQGDKVVAAFRGELGSGEHAEYTLLERKVKDDALVGATVYTTLEPCIVRNPPKVSCADRLIERKVKRVVIGTLDPNPTICGRGERQLRDHNIVVDRFPNNLIEELDDLNRDFNRAQREAAKAAEKPGDGQRTEAHGDRKVLTVFIGSPGDAAKEMEVTREVVDDINKAIYEIGWEIDLRGWEDSLPGHGRPPATVNADVRASQLFVGVLYTKWGSPSGGFSSAFEEQFEIARKDSGRDIWLFFKRVPAAQMADPGEQLSKVLAFRQRIEASREVVYKDLANGSEWKRQLPTLLYKHILGLHERSRPKTGVPTGTVVRSIQVAQEGVAQEGVAEVTEVPTQIREMLAGVGAGVRSPEEVAPFQAARLHLLSTSLLANHVDIRLGVHEVNLVYQHREQLEPAAFESALLLRTVVAGEQEVIPGWYWFRDLDPAECARDLFRLAMFVREEAVRVRAADLLVRTAVMADFPTVSREDLLRRFLTDESQAVRKEKIKYVAAVGSPSDLPLLDRAADDAQQEIRDQAAEGRALLLARSDPDRALAEATARRQPVPVAVLAEIRNRVQGVQVPTLVDATGHPEETVRRFAVEVLESRGEWTEERALALKDDTAASVKALSYRALVRAGRQVDLDGADACVKDLVRPALLERLRLQPLETLRATWDWFSLQNIDAYEAAAEQYPAEMMSQVRTDLADQFAGLRRESIARFRSRYGAEQVAAIEALYSKSLDGFIRGLYTRIALEVLGRHGTKLDAAFGRRYLSHDSADVRRAAVSLLAAFGDVSDCSELVRLAKSDWASKRDASRAAVRVCGGSPVTIHSLVESGDPVLTEIGLAEVTAENREAFTDVVRQLMLHETAVIRRLAVATLQKLWANHELEAMLKWYISQGRYYYNVVCWLDRVLYAPPPLRKLFIEELQEPHSG